MSDVGRITASGEASIPTERVAPPVVVLTEPTPELVAEFANIDGPWTRGEIELDEVWKCLLSAQVEGTQRETAIGLSGQWRPIETAPRAEYESLLVVDADVGVCLGYWAPDDDGVPGGWMAQDTAGEYCGDLTHWMPLPASPTTALEADAVGIAGGDEP